MLFESCLQLYFDDNEFMVKHGYDGIGMTGCSTRARTQVNKELCNQTFGIIKAKYVIEFIPLSELAMEFLVAWGLVAFTLICVSHILGFPDDMDLTISCNVCNQKISYQGEDVLVCKGCNMEVQTRPPTEVPNDKVHNWFTVSISIF